MGQLPEALFQHISGARELMGSMLNANRTLQSSSLLLSGPAKFERLLNQGPFVRPLLLGASESSAETG
jgi:hypothetical protein